MKNCQCGAEAVKKLSIMIGTGKERSRGMKRVGVTLPLCAVCWELEQQQEAGRYGYGRGEDRRARSGFIQVWP